MAEPARAQILVHRVGGGGIGRGLHRPSEEQIRDADALN